MIVDLLESAGYLVAFVLPVMARSSRQLLFFGLSALIPTVVLGIITASAGTELTFRIALGLGIAAIFGILARKTSLLARRMHHRRPHSFWIEAVYAGMTLGILDIAGV